MSTPALAQCKCSLDVIPNNCNGHTNQTWSQPLEEASLAKVYPISVRNVDGSLNVEVAHGCFHMVFILYQFVYLGQACLSVISNPILYIFLFYEGRPYLPIFLSLHLFIVLSRLPPSLFEFKVIRHWLSVTCPAINFDLRGRPI